MTQTKVQQQYQEAIHTLASKLEQDRLVLAAILYGSLSYDQVWEKSDIDLWIIVSDEFKKTWSRCLVENDVIIHAEMIPRNGFKRMMEQSLQGSWFDFTFSKSTLLFSRDESIEQWYKNFGTIGARDRDYALLRQAIEVMGSLAKAEKFCYVKQDYRYSFLWMMYVVNGLARIEVILNDEAPGREVIYQALKYNPGFFHVVYTELIDLKKNERIIQQALNKVHTYLTEKTDLLFGPLLDYLKQADGPQTIVEMRQHFKHARIGGLDFACEWLVEKNILEKVASPLRLMAKSRVELEEPAYYYDGNAEDEGIEFV